jgi:regulator of sigma E protease
MPIAISVLGFLLFVGLVLVHEWGHYRAARRNGVDVEEFGIGFPPQALGRKTKSGMILSLNWLPLGGFVKLKGEHDSDTRKGSFGAASLAAKCQIMLAGVTMNLIVGVAILTLLALTGMPKLIDSADFGQDQFTVASDTKISRQEAMLVYIEPGSPADQAGLKPFDSISQVSGKGQVYKVSTPADLKKATTNLAGQKVSITAIHDGNPVTKTVTLRSPAEVKASLSTDNPKGYLGVQPYALVFQRSTWSAPVVAIGFTGQIIELTGKAFWQAISGLGSTVAGGATGNTVARQNGQDEATRQVGGPIAIFKILSSTGKLGMRYMLAIIALISLTLAFMNILPIPALDGGRLAVTLISQKVLKNPLSKSAEERIHGTGMAVLLSLMVLVTIVDVRRFF